MLMHFIPKTEATPPTVGMAFIYNYLYIYSYIYILPFGFVSKCVV